LLCCYDYRTNIRQLPLKAATKINRYISFPRGGSAKNERDGQLEQDNHRRKNHNFAVAPGKYASMSGAGAAHFESKYRTKKKYSATQEDAGLSPRASGDPKGVLIPESFRLCAEACEN
jgi:hypothetical protein